MRTKGATTKKDCFILDVIVNDEIIFHQKYKTLKDIAEELNLSYNQVVEISRGRKKEGKGKYDTIYKIRKYGTIGKIKQNTENIKELNIDEENIE